MAAHHVDSLTCVLVIWGAGMATSFFANRALFRKPASRRHVRLIPACRRRTTGGAAYPAGRTGAPAISYREGAPWYQRFGPERNQQLLAPLFPAMRRRQTGWCATWPLTSATATERLCRPAAQQSSAYATGEQRYKQLKALLMTAHPERPTPPFSALR